MSPPTADPNAPIRLLIADHHALVRDGLTALFAKTGEFEVVGQATSGPEAVERCARLRPDVTLMDLGLPELDGVQTLREIRRRHPDAKVLILTARAGDEDIARAMEAGARGYALKHLGWANEGAVRAVARGLRHLAPEAAAALASRVGTQPLTDRERNVLGQMTRGGSNREIGEWLGISEATVKTHITAILGKLQVKDRTQAVVQALQRGMWHLPAAEPR